MLRSCAGSQNPRTFSLASQLVHCRRSSIFKISLISYPRASGQTAGSSAVGFYELRQKQMELKRVMWGQCHHAQDIVFCISTSQGEVRHLESTFSSAAVDWEQTSQLTAAGYVKCRVYGLEILWSSQRVKYINPTLQK